MVVYLRSSLFNQRKIHFKLGLFSLVTFCSRHDSGISSLIISFQLQTHDKILNEETHKISQAQNKVNIFREQKSNRKSKAESETEVTVLHSAMGEKYRVIGDPESSPLLEIRG